MLGEQFVSAIMFGGGVAVLSLLVAGLIVFAQQLASELHEMRREEMHRASRRAPDQREQKSGPRRQDSRS